MDTRIKLVLALIERDIRSRHHPRAMANHVKLSESRFYDLFRQATGTVPARYIRDLRFQRAKELLANPQLSVKEIANSVGIQDVSHFVRDFQKMYGMSPRRFRRGFEVVPPPERFDPLSENSLTNRSFG